MPATFRTLQLALSGDRFTLTHCARPDVAPARRQVLIRVGAASLNFRDLLILQDTTSNREGLVPLSDGAGTVVSVGAEVSRWKQGARVAVNFFPSWREGPFSPSVLTTALGGGRTDGMLSEFVLADEGSLVGIPSHLTLTEAATLPCAGVTAWHALFERGHLQPGETVLVQGTGGVAVFGLQLATAHGAKVIVISSSDAKLARARAMGAWGTINYRSHPAWELAALELTEGKGVDHILELGGPDTYDRSVAAIAPGGRIAQIGVLTGFAPRPNLLPLQFKNASVNGVCVGSVRHFDLLNRFMLTHGLRPVIDKTFAFDDAPAAYEYLRTAGHFGKVAVDMT